MTIYKIYKLIMTINYNNSQPKQTKININSFTNHQFLVFVNGYHGSHTFYIYHIYKKYICTFLFCSFFSLKWERNLHNQEEPPFFSFFFFPFSNSYKWLGLNRFPASFNIFCNPLCINR